MDALTFIEKPLDAKKLSPVYVLHGDEDFLKRQVLTVLRKVVFGSDVFGGEIEEFDREIERYRKMLDTCGVGQEAQSNIFGGTLRRILDGSK